MKLLLYVRRFLGYTEDENLHRMIMGKLSDQGKGMVDEDGVF